MTGRAGRYILIFGHTQTEFQLRNGMDPICTHKLESYDVVGDRWCVQSEKTSLATGLSLLPMEIFYLVPSLQYIDDGERPAQEHCGAA